MLQAVTISSIAARLIRVLVRRVLSTCVSCAVAEPDEDTEMPEKPAARNREEASQEKSAAEPVRVESKPQPGPEQVPEPEPELNPEPAYA